MAGKRQAAKRTTGSGWVILVLALLVVGGYLAYVAWQRGQQTAAAPQGQTANVVEEDRMIYGGQPRAKAGAGNEAEFEVLRNHAYVAGYSETRKDPLWVAYRVFHNEHPFNLPRPS